MITVYVDDPRLFLRVIEALRARGAAFRVPRSPRPPCPGSGVVLTDRPELYEGCGVPVLVLGGDWERRLEEALCLARGAEEYSILIVGIDPGDPPTYVVIADDELVERGEAEPRLLLEKVRSALRRIPHARAVVRIGDSGERLDEIIGALAEKPLRSARIELVDEHGTSRTHPRFREVRDRDVSAAINIAYKRGIRLEVGGLDEEER